MSLIHNVHIGMKTKILLELVVVTIQICIIIDDFFMKSLLMIDQRRPKAKKIRNSDILQKTVDLGDLWSKNVKILK